MATIEANALKVDGEELMILTLTATKGRWKDYYCNHRYPVDEVRKYGAKLVVFGLCLAVYKANGVC